jgi:uncharacterized protein
LLRREPAHEDGELRISADDGFARVRRDRLGGRRPRVHAPERESDASFQTGRHEFIVGVADNASLAARGLRYRHDILSDSGFLILQSQAAPSPITVSADGQALPVDLLFIASNGTVMDVYPCIPTDSSTPITSTSPVGAALELACGTITRDGIRSGNQGVGARLGPCDISDSRKAFQIVKNRPMPRNSHNFYFTQPLPDGYVRISVEAADKHPIGSA